MSSADSTPTAVETDAPAQLGEELGRGGMGTVLVAHDKVLDRSVAIKVLRALGGQHIARLLAEAKAMARLSHPNVVHVYDVVTSGDGAVIVMELVRGTTLRSWVAQGQPQVEILAKFRQAGEGLHAAHRAGLVHLDFKPSNVLIGLDGVAKVTDFGLARTDDLGSRATDELGAGIDRAPVGLEGGLASWGLQATMHGVVAGTPRYMSPEQHQGNRCGRATDVYAFCVALWESVSGTPPFAAEDAEGLLESKLEGPPPWTGTSAPQALVDAIRRGLAPDPEDRWDTLEPLLAHLAPASERRGRLRWLPVGAAIAIAGMTTAFALGQSTSGLNGAGPDLEGFGTASAFGEGGTRCTVQSLADEGPGTLRDCLLRNADSDTPLVVDFGVGGTIPLQRSLAVSRPHLTIDALTAPAPGVTLASGQGAQVGLMLTDDPERGRCAHDVLVQGLRFLGTWDGTAHVVEQGATLEINGRGSSECIRNVVFNRVTVLAASDAAGDMIGSLRGITVQYSAFLRSHHPMEITNRPGEPLPHREISLHHNVFAYFHERSPQLRGPIEDVDIVQNVFMNWNAYDFGGGYAIRMRCRDGDCPARINVESNHWASGSGDPGHALVFGKLPEADSDDGPIPPQVYMRGNTIPSANPNFGLAPARFERPPEASVTTVETPEAFADDLLPWVGAPHRTDIEVSVFADVRRRLLEPAPT